MNTFDISADTMVVTSCYVIEDRCPILFVSHEQDEEGGSLWQFHCGNGDYSMERMMLVRLDTIEKIDPTISTIASLVVGHEATRNAIGSDWIVRPVPEQKTS